MAYRPKPIGDILAELMARRGYGRVQSAATFDDAWREATEALAIGPLVAEYTRLGALRGGRLEVFVSNSLVIQELGYEKESILKRLAKLLPDEEIKEIRCRVEAIR